MDSKKNSAPAAPSPERATTGGKSGKSKKGRLNEEEYRLEEEARQKAEQEERERKQREKQLAEEKKNREKKISELKSRELYSFYDMINELNFKAEKYHKERRELYKWDRYRKCDGSPDPVNSGEINAFLSLWRDEKDQKNLKESLRVLNLALDLINELNFLTDDHINEVDSEKLIEKYQKTIKDLVEVIRIKLNEASYSLLLGASEKLDPETSNFSVSEGNDKIFYCIWANLSHNPKIKDFTFHKKNFSFILPRPLTLANVAVRCLFTNFDIYSQRSKTFACRVKKEKFEFVRVEEKPAAPVKETSDIDEDDLPPELKALMQKSESNIKDEPEAEKEEIEADVAKPVEEVPKEEINPDLKTADDHRKNFLPDELAVLQELSDTFVIDLRNYLPLGEIIHFGLYQIPPQPKKIKQWIITKRDDVDQLLPFVYPTTENLALMSWQEYWIKKQGQEHSSLAPPGEHEDLGETLRSNMNLTMRSTDFLESTIGNETISSDANKQFLKSMLTKSNEQLVRSMKNEGPLHVNYKISSNLFFGEAPTLARWDEVKQHWRTDEILDFKFNEEQNEIHFKTYHFSPYCLMQDRHVHMPFQSWRMVPRESINSCMFTIETTSFELNFELKANEVRLYLPIRKQPEEDLNKTKKSSTTTTAKSAKVEQKLDYESHNLNPNIARVIEPIANKWFSVRKFKEVMKSIGLNIFPEPDSEKFVTITNKDKKLESITYRNMALCSCLVSFAYSKWNSEINDETKIVVLEQLHLTDKEPEADNFKCLLFTQDYISLTNSKESSDEFDHTCAKGTEEHADMFHMCSVELCKNHPDKNLVECRINQIDPIFYETCLEFLESTKVLTFS